MKPTAPSPPAADARVPLQVGFNRRFAKELPYGPPRCAGRAYRSPQLLRSLTRDPALNNPAASPQWVIFLETLIHDFDTLRVTSTPAPRRCRST